MSWEPSNGTRSAWLSALLALATASGCGGGDSGGGTTDPDAGSCMADADCDDGNECTQNRCVAGACLNLEQPAGASCTLADGSSGYCDGAGACAGCTIDSQCDDGNPCTDDACNVGSCMHADTAAGGSCTLADGSSGYCDGAGACVGCTDDAHCDDGNPCTDDACDTASGTCTHTNSSAASGCLLSSGASGYCDGAGLCAECTEDGHCDDGNPCTRDRCFAGACLNLEQPAGASCTLADGSSGYCDGAGACVGCTTDSQCDDGNPCTVDSCNSGSCTSTASPDGTPCADDGDECTQDVCSSGSCTHPPQPAGLSCVQSGGDLGYCDGASPAPSCVACLSDSHCDDGDSCTEDRCVGNVCTYTPRLRFLSLIYQPAAGANHTCISRGSSLLCWGANDRGQLGLGDTTDRTRPVLVPLLQETPLNLRQLGGDSTFARMFTNVMLAWGANDSGQLGLGDTTGRTTPSVTSLGDGLRLLRVGARHACRLLQPSATLPGSSGIQCWGDNRSYQLGDGSTTDRDTPTDVIDVPPDLQAPWVLDVGGEHTCISKQSTVACWGANDQGQAGPAGSSVQREPFEVGLGSNINQLALGARHSCAQIGVTTVACWGANDRGQLGNGSNTARPMDGPARIDFAPNRLMGLWAGDDHTCVALSLGSGGVEVQCWGANDRGQLGLGDTTDRDTPTRVSLPVSGFASVGMALGEAHTCASINGTLLCWGANDRGQLGLGDTTDRDTPTPVSQWLDCR